MGIETAKDMSLIAENRMATPKPKTKILVNNHKVFNDNYINNWNKYVGDRIRMRKNMQTIRERTLKIITNKNKNIKDEWIFLNNTIPLNKFKSLTDEQLNQYGNNIKNLIQYCNEKNIKCYIVNMPGRDNFIREKIGLSDNLIRKSNIGEQLNTYLRQQKIDFQIINLWDKMFELNGNEMLFYKQDWHQTNVTSFLIYNETLKAIRKDFKNIFLPSEKDFNIYFSKTEIENGLCRKSFSGIPHYECDVKTYKDKGTDYKIIKHKDSYEIKIKATAQEDLFGTYYSKGNNLTILLLGRSYANRADKYFPYSFKNYYRKGIWHNDFATQYCKNLKQYNFDRGCFSKEHLEAILNTIDIKPNIIVLFDYDLEYTKDFY